MLIGSGDDFASGGVEMQHAQSQAGMMQEWPTGGATVCSVPKPQRPIARCRYDVRAIRKESRRDHGLPVREWVVYWLA